MRLQINTNGAPIKDKDIRALYIIHAAFSMCQERMIIPTLQFFADRYGYKLAPKTAAQFFALLLATSFMLQTVYAGTEPAPPFQSKSLETFANGLLTAKSITVAVYPTLAPKLNGGSYGAGIAALYPIGDYVFTGLRLDLLDHNFYAASASAGVQYSFHFGKVAPTVFGYTGVGAPLSGAGSKDHDVNVIGGTGVVVPFYQNGAKHLTVSAFYAGEYWSDFDKILIHHAGVMAKFDF